jgi:hypothetical protein
MIGNVSAVGETPPFQECDILIRDGFSELIEKTGFPDPCLGDDGDGLASAFLGAFLAIEKKFKFPLSSHEGR